MGICIELASAAHKPLLKGLLSECLAEFEQYGGSGADYLYFEAYWQEPESRWPYLVRRDGECIGFAFVNTWSPSGRGTDFSIAEFYIVAQARGQGAGRDAATAVLHAHPGLWELSVMALNTTAQAFWPQVIDGARGRDAEQIKSDSETIYRFTIDW
jgi:predicted acetyltransferase